MQTFTYLLFPWSINWTKLLKSSGKDEELEGLWVTDFISRAKMF